MSKFIGTRLTLPNLATAPSSPAAGDAYYDTVANTVYVYNGTSWVNLAETGGEIYYQAGTPSSPSDGDIWIDSDDDVAGVSTLTDSTSTTSSTVAASATAVKSAYDLANGAIPKTLTTTTGDIIYASAANTPARLGIGNQGDMLVVTSGSVVAWARQDGQLLGSGTLSSAASSFGVTGLAQGWRNLRIILRNGKSASSDLSYVQVQFNGSYSNFVSQTLTLDASSYYPWWGAGFYLSPGIQPLKNNTWDNSAHYEINIFNYSSTTLPKNGHYLGGGQSATDRVQWSSGAFHWNNTAAITAISFAVTNQWAAGLTIELYGEGPL